MKLHLPLLCLLIALFSGTPLLGQDPVAARWMRVEVPRGFQLVLATGEVTNRPGEEAHGLLRWEGDLLAADVELRALPRGAAQEFAMGDGEPVPALEAREGCQGLFDLGEGAFGYLRVAAQSVERLELEVCTVPAGATRAAREPAQVTAEAQGARVRLSWEARPGARYRVLRKLRAARRDHSAVPLSKWTEIAVVDGGELFDEEDLDARLAEYRVERLPDGERAVRFGSAARGTAPMWAAEEALAVERGQYVSLLSGTCLPVRHDIQIENVAQTGVQFRAAEGVRLRNSSTRNTGSWRADDMLTGSTPERIYLQVGREATVLTAHGLYARLTAINGVDGVRLQRVMDLGGGDLLPRAPAAPEASWSPERGVQLEFESLDSETLSLLAAPPRVLVERETVFELGEWSAVLTGEPGETLLTDPEPDGLQPVRYRFRYLLESGARSLPSEPLTVLVGDAGDGFSDAALERAIGGLGSADFDERLRARRLIEQLGERAWPALREALASDDPEIAAAAQELLGGGAPGTAAGAEGTTPAALTLRAHAERMGVEAEPPEGLLDDDPLRRVQALLATQRPDAQADIARAAAARRWWAVLADADPDRGVRAVCEHLLTVGRDPLTERVLWRGAAFDLPEAWSPSERRARWMRFFSEEPEPVEVIRLLMSELDPTEPLGALPLLHGMWDLFLARGDAARGREAVERAQLALSLTGYAQEQADPVFQQAADSLVRDPAVRLRAMRDLADLREVAAHRAGERRVVVLEEPNLALLEYELADLEGLEHEGVDIVLPAGDYVTEGSSTVAVQVDDVRLVAEGEVTLHCGLRISGRDVQLIGLRVDCPNTAAVLVQDGSAQLRDCTLLSVNTGVQLLDGVAELYGCRLLGHEDRPATGIRSSGKSLLIARDTLIDAGASGASVSGVSFFERCAFTSRQGRTCLDSVREGRVGLVDCFLQSDGVVLSKLQQAVLDGCVIVTRTQAAQSFSRDVVYHEDGLRVLGPRGDFDRYPGVAESPLGR